MDEQRKYDLADGQQVALSIEMIKSVMHGMDWEAFEHFNAELAGMASNYDATAALNRGYTIEKRNLLIEQAKGFDLLLHLRQSLMKCDELKQASDLKDLQLAEMSKMFG